jgi:methylaspartate mutase sigma subunit
MRQVARNPYVILSTVSSDSHTWNLVFLQLLLKELGCEVKNLGACVPDDELIEAVRTHAPDSVVISSVNGHGHIDGTRLITSLRADEDPAVAEVPVIIGGKLGIQGAADTDIAGNLIAAGFDAVFTDDATLPEFSLTLARLVGSGKSAAVGIKESAAIAGAVA